MHSGSTACTGHGATHRSSPLPLWLPTSIASTEAAFLADAISNLDEYGTQQNELVLPGSLPAHALAAIQVAPPAVLAAGPPAQCVHGTEQ